MFNLVPQYLHAPCFRRLVQFRYNGDVNMRSLLERSIQFNLTDFTS